MTDIENMHLVATSESKRFGSAPRPENKVIVRAMLQRRRAGVIVRKIAEEFGCSERQVYRCLDAAKSEVA